MLICNVSSYASSSIENEHCGHTYSLARIFTLPVFSSLGLPMTPRLHCGHWPRDTHAIILPFSPIVRRVKKTHSSVDVGSRTSIASYLVPFFLKFSSRKIFGFFAIVHINMKRASVHNAHS